MRTAPSTRATVRRHTPSRGPPTTVAARSPRPVAAPSARARTRRARTTSRTAAVPITTARRAAAGRATRITARPAQAATARSRTAASPYAWSLIRRARTISRTRLVVRSPTARSTRRRHRRRHLHRRHPCRLRRRRRRARAVRNGLTTATPITRAIASSRSRAFRTARRRPIRARTMCWVPEAWPTTRATHASASPRGPHRPGTRQAAATAP